MVNKRGRSIQYPREGVVNNYLLIITGDQILTLSFSSHALYH